jgi:hypothetical protein
MEMTYVIEYTPTCRFLKIMNSTLMGLAQYFYEYKINSIRKSAKNEKLRKRTFVVDLILTTIVAKRSALENKQHILSCFFQGSM